MIKVATLCSQEDDFIRAADIFEVIGIDSLESKLGAYSAKGYFFQAILCILATGDDVKALSKLESFKNLDYNFAPSRECQFLTQIIEVFVNDLKPLKKI